MTALSFIIPLYNCEKYIAASLDAILSLDMDGNDYEIIVVDDGSTDAGAAIVRRYADTHNDIKLISRPNGGASAARNAGLDTATGEWIWFVDADDRIVPSLLASHGTVRQWMTQEDVDLICFNYCKTYSDHIEKVNDWLSRQEFSGEEYLRMGKGLYLWNKLFRRKKIGSKRFPNGTKNLEDLYFDYSVIIDVEHCKATVDTGYEYNQTNVSSTSRNRTPDNMRKLSDDTRTIFDLMLKDSLRLNGEKKSIYQSELNFSAAGYLFSLFCYYSHKDMQDGIRWLRSRNLYPVKRTGNRRADLFLCIANRPMWILCCRPVFRLLRRLFHSL